MATDENPKVYAISLPANFAEKAEGLAASEGRTMSELLLEAFHCYHALRIRESFDAIGEYAARHNPHGYTEEDVPRLIKEMRAEDARTRMAEQTQSDELRGRVAV